ncbi:alpha/beta hydrolase [Cryobacterium sp. 1639]|uniref:alpha/beta fold hydrolase n=1 Tax=Cryobacterium inferilacus TaxID=2866629 RepID=UPI001C73D596|nr:alpha/beta hydrolase [Cryobacterium sp. 1639]MBX0301072.1 alpha/beta hydrolase [Cryobacterium sp. 1639]
MGAMKPSGRFSHGSAAAPDTNGRLPELAGVRHRFLDLPGLRMHVAEAGDGPPLLLLHGFPQHWWAWRKVIPGLAEHYRVICPDLRGAGWTDAPPNCYTSEQLVADVMALLDEMRLEKVDILGYDWGGMVGFRVCLAHPDRVRRFVVLAAPHPYPDLHLRALLYIWRVWPMFAVAMPGLGRRLLQSGRLPRWLMTSDTSDPAVFSPDDLDAFVSRLKDPARAAAGSELYRSFILAEAKRSSAGAYRGTRLTTPTLSLYGTVLYGNTNQSVTQPEILGGYEDYADDLTQEHVPGTGYYIAEERPDVVVRRTLEFLSAR